MSQLWLVALREVRERSRSKAFRASVVLMILIVVGAIAVPAAFDDGPGKPDVGITGDAPEALVPILEAQGAHVRSYNTVAAGEEAVRERTVDVLVADGRRLAWRGEPDPAVRTLVLGAIQLVEVQARAAASGISQQDPAALVAPVDVDEQRLSSVAGRSEDDETAAMLMTVVLFIAISTYGNLVLTGVVEEKASRVVEVLLARMPARTLLAGKIGGIGVLGLAQIALMAVAAVATMATVDSVDVPAVRGTVLAWVVVWFVLGYALYATVYGAVGSLASRTEDAQSAAGPITAIFVAGYFASFIALGRPESGVALALSLVPLTAPLAMPNRIAMGAAAWWEPLLAVVLTLAAIALLVRLGGRVYSRAVLHSGPALKLRQAWRLGTG